MIDKEYGKFVIVCDICGEQEDERFYDFQEAVDFKKANDWKSKNLSGEWIDICPKCSKIDLGRGN